MKSNWVKIINKHFYIIINVEYITFIKDYMSKSKFVIDKLAKLFEVGLISYKDLYSEILNILRSKRDEIIFKMQLTSKEETDILNKRIEILEKKIDKLEKKNNLKKSKRVKKS